MKPSRQQSLDVNLRDAVADHLMSSAGKGASRLPRLRIPRVGAVDVVLEPQSGFTLLFVQRSDHLAAYKHLVGQLVGSIAHLHRCKSLELRQALEKVKGFKGGNLDVPEVAKRLMDDAKAGNVQIVIATEQPEVPQTYDHLLENFQPVLRVLQAWSATPVKQKKLCAGVHALVVELDGDKAKSIKPLFGKAEGEAGAAAAGAGEPAKKKAAASASKATKKASPASASKKKATKKKVAKKK
ncbi:MAG: hypothetical protein KC503_38970 [Myxococcales bacterium]|nr:hypothetical protein [Myxococcales bacterium]